MHFFSPQRLIFQQAPEVCEVGNDAAAAECVDAHESYISGLENKISLLDAIIAQNPDDNDRAKEVRERIIKEQDQYRRMTHGFDVVLGEFDELTPALLATDEGADKVESLLGMINLVTSVFVYEELEEYPFHQESYDRFIDLIVEKLQLIEPRVSDILVRNRVREFLGLDRLPETLENLRERVDGEDLSQFFPSIDGLGHLGEGVAYYVLKIPKKWDTPAEIAENMALICDDWPAVVQYNQDNGRTVQAGGAVHVPVSAFLDESIKQGRQVQFVEVTINEKNPDKLERVLTAMCEPDPNLADKVHVFTESYFYQKPHPRNRYAIPISMLRMDWRASFVAEHPETPLNLGRDPYKNPQLFARMTIEGLNPYHPESLDTMIERGLVNEVTDDANFVWAQDIDRRDRDGDGNRGEWIDQCPEENRYLTSYAEDALNEIGATFFDNTGAYIRITAMYRSKQYQRDIRAYEPNAADQSTHFFANSFDIAKNAYCGAGRSDQGWPPNGDRVGGHMNDLRDVLRDMQEAGKIMFITEGNCYHVTVINPDIGGGHNIARPHRSISPEPEYAPIHPELVPEDFDPTQIDGFEEFSTQLLATMRSRKKQDKTMTIGEIQAEIVTKFLPKVRAAGHEETARLLEGRSWEVAHVMAILVSRHETQDSKAATHKHHLYVYDEDPTVFQDNASFSTWKQNYDWFKEGKIGTNKTMTLVDSSGQDAGTYNMYEYLTESNLDEVTEISRSLLMAALAARETSFVNLRNAGENSGYLSGVREAENNVFGYFQITAVQRGKIEDRAKEIFEELDDTIPGENWDMSEFTVEFNGHTCHINPKMEIAIAVAMMEHQQAVFRQTNHFENHPDQEMLALVAYNGGGAPIEYLLQFGVSVARYKKDSTGKYKLAYVDDTGTVNVSWITAAQRNKVAGFLSDAMAADNGSIQEVVPIYNLRRYFRKTLFTGPGTQSQFVAGREVGLRVSEIEKVFTCKPGVVGQVYISEVISHAIAMQYMDDDNYDGMHENALRDAMILLSSPEDVISEENLEQIG